MVGDVPELNEQLIRQISDYPKPGIIFKDITPLIADKESFQVINKEFAEISGSADFIAGIEARGFIFASATALLANKGFIPIRKSGKLPGKVISQRYELEYGFAELEIASDLYAKGSKILIIDDVLATGGTAIAAVELCEKIGLEVIGLAFLLEISALQGRSRIKEAFETLPITSLLAQ
jgi:adenine phosphoribosyltransferase